MIWMNPGIDAVVTRFIEHLCIRFSNKCFQNSRWTSGIQSRRTNTNVCFMYEKWHVPCTQKTNHIIPLLVLVCSKWSFAYRYKANISYPIPNILWQSTFRPSVTFFLHYLLFLNLSFLEDNIAEWLLFDIKRQSINHLIIFHCHFLLKCLYQERKVSGHVFVLRVSIVPLSTIILLHFWACSILFSFYVQISRLAHHFVSRAKKRIGFDTTQNKKKL